MTDTQFHSTTAPVPNVHKMLDVLLSETQSIFAGLIRFGHVVFMSLLMPYVAFISPRMFEFVRRRWLSEVFALLLHWHIR